MGIDMLLSYSIVVLVYHVVKATISLSGHHFSYLPRKEYKIILSIVVDYPLGLLNNPVSQISQSIYCGSRCLII